MEQSEHTLYWLNLIQMVNESGNLNKDSCRIPVNNTWNFELLDTLLTDYWDREVIDLLKFGFPIERDVRFHWS